jgi:hypothetical protein
MALLKTLGLPPPKAANKSTNKATTTDAETQRARAELERKIAEMARGVAAIADPTTHAEAAAALKAADEMRKKIVAMGDQVGRAERYKKVSDYVEIKVRKKLGAENAEQKKNREDYEKRERAEAAGEEVPEEPHKAGVKLERKLAVKAVAGAGKFGLGGELSQTKESDDGHGGKTKLSGAFGGKVWVESKKEPDKDEYVVSFHFSGSVSAGTEVEREGKASVKGGLSIKTEAEFSISHRFDAEENRRYLADVRRDHPGDWPELELAGKAMRGDLSGPAAEALLAQVRAQGGTVGALKQMKEGDESEAAQTGEVEAEAGVSLGKGGTGVGVQVGTKLVGSLSRKIAREGGKFVITMRSAKAMGTSGGAGVAIAGGGMNVAVSDTLHSSLEIRFELDERHPKFDHRARQILAAHSIEDAKSLRVQVKDVPSYETESSGETREQIDSSSVHAVGLDVEKTSDFTKVVSRGPDGSEVEVYSGSNRLGASAKIGDRRVAGGSTTDELTAGSGNDNEGFGETTSTKRESDYGRSLDKIAETMKKGDMGALVGMATGDTKVLQEKVELKGGAFKDDAYQRLIALAAKGEAAWTQGLRAHGWDADSHTMLDWITVRAKIVDADGDRKRIARALAEFESGVGTGRHETVRVALGETISAFEFPESMAARRPLYDSLVIEDPIEPALSGGDEKVVAAKLRSIVGQLDTLRKELTAAHGREEFRSKSTYLEMCQRVDTRRAEVREAAALVASSAREVEAKAAAAKLPAKERRAAIAKAEGASAADAAKTRRDVLAQRVQDLRNNLNESFQAEAAIFKRWEEDLKGSKALGFLPVGPDLDKLIAHQKQLRELYPKWEEDLAAVRALMKQADSGFGEADLKALPQPRREHYRALRARQPHADWNRPDGV